MFKTKAQNRIKEINTKYEKNATKKNITIHDAIKLEKEYLTDIKEMRSLSLDIKSNLGEKNDLFKRNKLLLEKIKREVKNISIIIINTTNTDYNMNFTLKNEIFQNENYYYENGILETLINKGSFNPIFQDLLKEIIPSHPKEEYPNTRKLKRKFILHTGDPNSGKTFNAIEDLKKATNGIYLAPLRLLALEIYDKLNMDGVLCDLITGEEEIYVPFSKHIASTIEKANYKEHFDVAVIDEAQKAGDNQRGFAWSRAILGIKADIVHVICSKNAAWLITKLIEDCEDELEIIEHERTTPLILEESNFLFTKSVEKGDALIVFSRRMVLQVAAVLANQGIKSSIIYGNLPPETRRKQVDLFIDGKSDVIISTDAIGMGLNLPIRRVVLLETTKFDGKTTRPLDSQEVKQIAGRAGRKGMYEKGFVNCIDNKGDIRQKLNMVDMKIKKAYISPMESTILALPYGTLKERLVAWTKYNIGVSYFDKIDISVQLELIDRSAEFEEKLSLEQIYKAINIPFNHKDPYILKQWLGYLGLLNSNLDIIDKPDKKGNDLDSLETYYKAISLYYSFSKIFDFNYDFEWVQSERLKISEEIHFLLQDSIKSYSKKCKRCNVLLEWNHIFAICDKCYER